MTLRRWAVAAAAFTLIGASTATADASVEGVTWTHPVGRWPTVYVQDSSGPLWPVAEAVKRFGHGYRYGSCRTHRHCVHVYSGRYGNTGWDGETRYSYDPATHHFVTAGFRIRLNTTAGAHESHHERLAVAEHELGHAIGLNHDRRRDIMNPNGYYTTISSYEQAELFNLYGVKY